MNLSSFLIILKLLFLFFIKNIEASSINFPQSTQDLTIVSKIILKYYIIEYYTILYYRDARFFL